MLLVVVVATLLYVPALAILRSNGEVPYTLSQQSLSGSSLHFSVQDVENLNHLTPQILVAILDNYEEVDHTDDGRSVVSTQQHFDQPADALAHRIASMSLTYDSPAEIWAISAASSTNANVLEALCIIVNNFQENPNGGPTVQAKEELQKALLEDSPQSVIITLQGCSLARLSDTASAEAPIPLHLLEVVDNCVPETAIRERKIAILMKTIKSIGRISKRLT